MDGLADSVFGGSTDPQAVGPKSKDIGPLLSLGIANTDISALPDSKDSDISNILRAGDTSAFLLSSISCSAIVVGADGKHCLLVSCSPMRDMALSIISLEFHLVISGTGVHSALGISFGTVEAEEIIENPKGLGNSEIFSGTVLMETTDEKSSRSGITLTSSGAVEMEEIGENSRHSIITFISSGSVEMDVIIEKDSVS